MPKTGKCQWEVSIIQVENCEGKKFKVTRRFPEFSISETKVFRKRKNARKQFDEWLK